ncbi:trypsin-like peptidase domain-containing protein [Sulfitobacter sp. D35]|uniref:trypsin-like peptidase domain-containing protein n=1 Tax=Sulfitobacter sp. D35 TaxID=3083252 RepID=UPI00296E746C|nr:trypsin-like peptidase domain-containing protein [Sulfitobacter sp. D35]MDW4499869.1 trypsin-like peptidase domain-containing protein [Sulfitobacter sp. D35]
MMRLIALAVMIVLGLTRTLHAQSGEAPVWVQIEAQPSLAEATERARDYAARLADVNGFDLGTGWYGVALGPYAPSDAAQVLRVYRAEGLIPRDSYIAESSAYRRQFWPVGANVLDRGVIAPPEGTAPQVPDAPDTATVAEPASPPAPADETPQEARASERLLSEAERRGLQTALQWAGHYNAAIDGQFGRGTRSSMAAWQAANAHEVTGILTTAQRNELMGQYNAVLDGLGLEPLRETATGIEILIPKEVVAFSRYEPPFAHFDAKGEIDALVLLISQEGDRDTLHGLYDIMQTLEIVPLNGPRQKSDRDFSLVGQNATRISETHVSLEGGRIKGFTLVWPAGDEERRERLVAEMRRSFTRIDGVLDAAAGADAAQQIDLVSGLRIRKPRLSRSGFFVDGAGAVVTTSEAVQSCSRITLDEDYEATVTAEDSGRGIAILRPSQRLAPSRIAQFSPVPPRLQSEVAVAGYPFEDALNAPTMTFGTLAELRGLRGEEEISRLDLAPLPGDAGGPVIDASGNVLGMLLPRAGGAQQLPEDVSFALAGGAIAEVMRRAGLTAATGSETAGLDAYDITSRGQGMTVLVSCWD